jgi:DnaJ-class molecular chaperone
MKQLNYTKEDCLLCKGSGEIKVSPDDLVICLCSGFKTCPMCGGKGHLNILQMETIKDG